MEIGPAFDDLRQRPGSYELNDRVNVYAGVDNIFDEYMFIAGTNGDNGQATGWTTFPDIYDGLGRRFYGGFRLSF